MFLQTLGALALRGDAFSLDANTGPQRKTLERLAFVLLEKEVSRDVFADLFFAYADDPQRELRRAVRNLNAFFAQQGLAEVIQLERKTLSASFKTDVELIEEHLAEQNLEAALELYKGGFLGHIAKGNGPFRSWVFEKRRFIAKRLFDALVTSLEGNAVPEQAHLSSLWLLFEHATDFSETQSAREALAKVEGYAQGLLSRIYPLLQKTNHPDLPKAEQTAKHYGLIFEPVLPDLATHQESDLLINTEHPATPKVMAVAWVALGVFLLFLSYGYFAASRDLGYYKPNAFFANLSKPLAPFWGMAAAGSVFFVFLAFTKELLRHRSGVWFKRLPVYDLLPKLFSKSFRVACCALVFTAFGVLPVYAQVHFFRVFLGLDATEAGVYTLHRDENGSIFDITKLEPEYCGRNLTCTMLFAPYPASSMWQRNYIYGFEERGQHFDYYPYIGPALVIIFEAGLLILALRVFVMLFDVRAFFRQYFFRKSLGDHS